MSNESAIHNQSITYNLTVTSECPTINRIEGLIDWINTIHIPNCLLLSSIDELKNGKILLDIAKYLLKQKGYIDEASKIRTMNGMKPVDLFNLVLKIIERIDNKKNISIFKSNVNMIAKKEDLMLDLIEVLKSINEAGIKKKVNYESNEVSHDSITANTKEIHYTNCVSIEDNQSQLNNSLKQELMKNLTKNKTNKNDKENLVKLKNGMNMIIKTFEPKSKAKAKSKANHLKIDLKTNKKSNKVNDDNISNDVDGFLNKISIEQNDNFSYHQKKKQRMKYNTNMAKQKRGFSYENEKINDNNDNNNKYLNKIARSTSFTLTPIKEGDTLYNSIMKYHPNKEMSQKDINRFFGNVSCERININDQVITYYRFNKPTDLIIDYDKDQLIKQRINNYNYTIQLSQGQSQKQTLTHRQTQSQSRNPDLSQSRNNTISLNQNDSSLNPIQHKRNRKNTTQKPPSLIKGLILNQKDTIDSKKGQYSNHDMRKWFINNTDEEEPLSIDNTKTQIYIWLQSINLFSSKAATPDIQKIPYQCTSGILLCDLINQCEGKFEAIHGIARKINKESQAMVNIRKALEHLRNKETFPSRYLWASTEIRNGNQKIIWELLEDIWRFYTNKLLRAHSTTNISINSFRPKSQSTRTSKADIYSLQSFQQQQQQLDYKSNTKPIIKPDTQGINLHFHNYLIKESCKTSKASQPKDKENQSIQIFNHFSVDNQCNNTKINNELLESSNKKKHNYFISNAPRPKNYIMFEKISLKNLKREIDDKESFFS